MMRSVADLWRTNKDTSWAIMDENDAHLGLLTLAELAIESFGDFPDEAEACLGCHCETVAYWCGQFLPYVGREDEIPKEWKLEVDGGDDVEDGNHRLVAAYLVKLDRIPVDPYGMGMFTPV